LPDRFNERSRLVAEAQFYGLQPLTQLLGAAEDDSGAPLSASQLDLNTNSSRNGYITIGYQGSFSFGRQGMGAGDINFRKVSLRHQHSLDYAQQLCYISSTSLPT